MKKILITLAHTIREILGIQTGRSFIRLQVFISRFGRLLGKRTGCSAYGYTDAGGHALRTLVSGRGTPTVVFEAGGYPAEVSGMLLIDPTQEEFVNWHGLRAPYSSDDDWRDIQASFTQAHDAQLPDGIPVVLITAMGLRMFPVFRARKARKQLEAFRPMWLKFHTEWLEKLPNGQHLITHTSGHLIPYEEPELIVRVIRQMVEQVRNPAPE